MVCSPPDVWMQCNGPGAVRRGTPATTGYRIEVGDCLRAFGFSDSQTDVGVRVAVGVRVFKLGRVVRWGVQVEENEACCIAGLGYSSTVVSQPKPPHVHDSKFSYAQLMKRERMFVFEHRRSTTGLPRAPWSILRTPCVERTCPRLRPPGPTMAFPPRPTIPRIRNKTRLDAVAAPAPQCLMY
ncbi:hypothetical protein EJ04DRAFT_41596 [Polyplosphaeria fusca]|uniref:Uncharacterized protein n=1 Tax=Polyplosphaeria fusca TaxID=682080 RepID=A0A9P4V5C6_9PLEO|nr:hypothetical protein EJ04DRAFT_41596 [Polyplosphaeria fusca]